MNVLIVDDELMMLEMAKDTVEEVVPCFGDGAKEKI